MTKPTHGGVRENSGRKPLPPGQKKIQRAVKLAPTVDKYLRTRENATATIEALILRSKAFREWKRLSR